MYQLIIVDNNDQIIVETILKGNKEKLESLAGSVFNLFSSLDPNKFKNTKPCLKPC